MHQPFNIQITQKLPINNDQPHCQEYHGILHGINIHISITQKRKNNVQYTIKEISAYPRINWNDPQNPTYQQDTEHLILHINTPTILNQPLHESHTLQDISYHINRTLNTLANPIYTQRRKILIHILQELRIHTSELFLELRADKNPDGATHPYHYYLTDNAPRCIKNTNDAIWTHMEKISDWINEYAIQYNPEHRDPHKTTINLRPAWIQQDTLATIIDNINQPTNNEAPLSQHKHLNIIRQMQEQHIPSLPKYLSDLPT